MYIIEQSIGISFVIQRLMRTAQQLNYPNSYTLANNLCLENYFDTRSNASNRLAPVPPQTWWANLKLRVREITKQDSLAKTERGTPKWLIPAALDQKFLVILSLTLNSETYS